MDSFLDELNQPQREAVEHIDSPMIIFAGAGTGKTRVITHRIAYLLGKDVSPHSILAVTFTNKAAEEMRKRVDSLVPGKGRIVWIATFHSFCAKLLRMDAKNLGLNPDFLIYDTSDSKSLIKSCVKELKLDEKTFKPGKLLDIISRSKDDLLDADSHAIHALASGDYFRQSISLVYKLYQKKLKQAGALDFGDLLLTTVTALKENEVLRNKYQERFSYIHVDEYQDTNHAQYMLAKILSSKHKNICVVGDDDQSIYSWRGADIRNILEFEKDYPRCRTVKLEENYRSTPNILACAWQVVKNNPTRVNKKIWTKNPEGSAITIIEAQNEINESERIAEEIQNMRQRENFKLSDFAVFYRTNAQSRVLEDAFRRAGIPYTVIGTVRFYDRAEVKAILAYLRLIHNPEDSVSFKRIVNVPRRGIGKTTIEALEVFSRNQEISLWECITRLDSTSISRGAHRHLTEFRKLMENMRSEKSKMTVKEIASMVLEKTGYIKELENEDIPEMRSKIENLHELISAIDEFERLSPDKSLAGYLTQVSLVNEIDNLPEENDKATMMTLHLAKGLEFEVVFISGLEDGLFPIGETAFSRDELEEERRLMYVGMTRAKKHLYLTWAAERRIYGKTKWNMASCFLEETKAGGKTIVLENPTAASESKNDSDTPFLYKKVYRSAAAGNWKKTKEPQLNDKSGFPIGSRVSHQQFGPGKIVDRTGAGDELKLVIVFDTGHWKKLLVKYANLEKI